MLAKLDGQGTVQIYPYSLAKLRADNPAVSFPRELTPEVLADFDVVEVVKTDAPTPSDTQVVQEGTPVKDGDRWVQSWALVDLTEGQIAQQLTDKRVAMVATARQLRLALLAQDKLDQVETAIAAAAREYQLNWEYATIFERAHPMIAVIAQTIGADDAAVDALFFAAMAIE